MNHLLLFFFFNLKFRVYVCKKIVEFSIDDGNRHHSPFNCLLRKKVKLYLLKFRL